MISFKPWYLCFIYFVVLLIIVPTLSAEEPWVLLHKGKGSDSDVYYNRDTIKKIDNNIIEVFIYWSNGNKRVVQQIHVDCKNRKTAIGGSDLYINNNEPQRYDFSKAGWIWFPPRNNVEKKLLKLVCK